MAPGSFSIKLSGNFRASSLCETLYKSFFDTLALDHLLPTPILTMVGMSGQRYRMFINNLVRSIHNPRYLEIGSWQGSTACSAMWGNSAVVTCIDNWSQFGGPKDVFLFNVELTKGNCQFSFIESDYRSVNYDQLGTHNIFMFDGPHEEIDQYDGIVRPLTALSSEFILIVDDYNWETVRLGTQRAIRDSDISTICSIEIRTTQDNTQPATNIMQNSDWHNGYFIAALLKN